MTKKELDERINELKKKAMLPPIQIEKIELAKTLVTKSKIIDDFDLFEALCSLNLLNAAIKMSFFRNKLSYEFIKCNLSRIITILISSKELTKIDVQIFISPKNAVYVSLNNLQFSFHHVPMNEIINDFKNSEINIPQQWHGVPLQMIAEELFDLSRKNSCSFGDS